MSERYAQPLWRTLDAAERVREFREVEDDELPALADRLNRLSGYFDDLEARWDESGQFRAATHRAVWEALRGKHI